MPTFDFPGVYIQEETGPGVIAGVGTSTAGFIGPAKRGPLKPRRVSSFDEFLSVYAAPDDKGNLDPYIKDPQTFYLAHAVRGFYENGGRQAFIVRIGNATSTVWKVKNTKSPTPDILFTIEALDPGLEGEKIKIAVAQSSLASTKVANGKSAVTLVNGKDVTVADALPFSAGDLVTVKKQDGTEATNPIEIDKITGKTLTLKDAPPSGITEVRIADIASGRKTIRMAGTAGLVRGSIVEIKGQGVTEVAVIEKVTSDLVTFASGLTQTFPLSTNTPTVTSREFDLTIAFGGETETFKHLSFRRSHERFAERTVRSKLVQLKDFSTTPPLDPVQPETDLPIVTHATEDNLNTLSDTDYKKGLEALGKVDDVNLVCIPDAPTLGEQGVKSLQKAMIDSCVGLKDRFAILDAKKGLSPAEVEEQRKDVQSERGFAALYYPWLEVRDPASTASPPLTMMIPPSGHMAGIFARTDQERGVHKAPANTDVRGVLGLERVVSDNEQGPRNLLGINFLRIFPGSNTVVVWGARTTVDPAVSDWLYVNVRRLLLFIEESVEEGIRPAVFEPNAPPLWKALKRTITQFLTQVWRDGGLFGDTPDQAFRVRIDEALNPASERARGKLFIEIRVAPARPAEFIVVKIGLFDGGADVQEG